MRILAKIGMSILTLVFCFLILVLLLKFVSDFSNEGAIGGGSIRTNSLVSSFVIFSVLIPLNVVIWRKYASVSNKIIGLMAGIFSSAILYVFSLLLPYKNSEYQFGRQFRWGLIVSCDDFAYNPCCLFYPKAAHK